MNRLYLAMLCIVLSNSNMYAQDDVVKGEAMIPAREIKEGGLYRHYKGDLYKVIKIALNTEGKVLTSPADIDEDVKLVIYKSVKPNAALGDDVWWVRPYRMFNETVCIDGVEQYRFSEVAE